jgi:hypothetical protein
MFEIINLSHALKSYGGNATITQATREYANVNISVGFHVGDLIFIAGPANPLSAGFKTIETIADADHLTVVEAIDVNEGPVAVTLDEAIRTPWLNVSWYAALTMVGLCEQATDINFEWSDDGITSRVTDAAVHSWVAATLSYHTDFVYAPYLRAYIINGGIDQAYSDVLVHALAT